MYIKNRTDDLSYCSPLSIPLLLSCDLIFPWSEHEWIEPLCCLYALVVGIRIWSKVKIDLGIYVRTFYMKCFM